MNKARFVDADEFEQITVNALDEALNALEILVNAFPQLFIEGQALEKPQKAFLKLIKC